MRGWNRNSSQRTADYSAAEGEYHEEKVPRNHKNDCGFAEHPIKGTVKTWMIVSWRHIDHLDDAYGKLLDTVTGTYDEAREKALGYVNFANGHHKPVGIVEEING